MKERIRTRLLRYMQGTYLFIGCMVPSYLMTQSEPIKELYGKKNTVKSPAKDKKKINFNFTDEELVDVINFLAAQKNVNVVMPMGANAITSKITLHIEHPLSIDEAWEMLITILDLAGYSLLAQNDIYTIVRNSKDISKEVIPLYVGMEPDQLPDSDERIRYLYYATNIKVPDDPKNATNEIVAIFKELLPDTASYQFDQKVNAILLTEKANNIRSVMKIIEALDQATFQETLEVIKLRYTPADLIAKLFTENILKTTGADATKYRAKGRRDSSSYFPEQVKLIAEPRTNKLLILGKSQAVERVKEFIYKYIDVELGTGESILHVYQLLYLDAVAFEPVLTNIVQSDKGGGTGQSTAAGPKTGVERFFEGVIIRADAPKTGAKETKLFGSNKLIIAAKNDDWQHIKKLIEQLDKPQPQVIIEVLIADLTLDDIRQLGSQIRNPFELPMPGGVNAQSAQIAPIVVNTPFPSTDPAPPNTTVAGDLLGNFVKTPSGNVSIADLVGPNEPGFPGSTLISFNDRNSGKTWGLTQLLQLFSFTKILSHPHVIATNNQKATVSIGDQRLADGETTATAAAPTIKKDVLPANLTVTIKPRISSSNNVNLQVQIDVTEFIGPLSDTRITRQIITNAYVQSQDIIALGGLIRMNEENSLNEVPILGRIPILGWFFKKRRGRNQKTNLTVFISPTVVQPRLRGGVNDYTKEYIEITERYTDEAQLFDTLRDPITRFFFKTNPDIDNSINEFIMKDEFLRDPSMVMLTPEQEKELPANKKQDARILKGKINQIMKATEISEPVRKAKPITKEEKEKEEKRKENYL